MLRLWKRPIGKAGTSALLILALTGCIGTGSPTPPGKIGTGPASIVENLPPADEAPDTPATALADSEGTDTLPPASSVPATQTQLAPQTYKAPASEAVLTFEPMVGAPKTVARELSAALGLRVAQQSLPVVARSDSKVTHRIKGYFSASESGDDCIVSYVWDIFNAQGKRINRITGSKKTPMVGSDPWASVKGPVLDEVAVDTAAKLKSWHASI
ncbi:hypothetical protein SAMN04515647_1726 [Cohaesibacter sp. ES.047]|uniref:hypothetical protein n=1 Tax=Cohaesibacter sp. ES.047 TaxID=1798205 RepID=UPI000BB6CCDA|nr:hypothetical protein [Cohaesibacter sp. ES.047]SNY91497.1 hypothetical protein SAMN04515647_1726 [Cohaesibacter sp. ES.047]